MTSKDVAGTPDYPLIALLLFFLFGVSGCVGPQGQRYESSSPMAGSSPQEVPLGVVVSSVEYGSATGLGAREATRFPGLPGRTNDAYPPELLARAEAILGEPIERISPMEWKRTRRNVFLVETYRGGLGVFMEFNGKYVFVNAKAELIAVNQILESYRFTRKDFADPQKACSFISEVIFLCRRPPFELATGLTLRTMERVGLKGWLQGTEESEAALKALFRDLEFVFEESRWTVSFNVLVPDGGVDRWTLIGQHNAQTNTNEVWDVDIARVKPAGTFSWVPRQ
jgi:hypothetical protein